MVINLLTETNLNTTYGLGHAIMPTVAKSEISLYTMCGLRKTKHK